MSEDFEDRLKSLQNEVNSLRNKLRIAESYQVHNLWFAASELPKFGVDRLKGSAAILEISTVSGKTTIGPVAISGFSPETIAEITADIRRTWNERTEIKP